jgi:hypothetical protein
VLLRDNAAKQKQFIDDGLALSLNEVVGQLPETLPVSIAYHLAVNHHTYFPEAHDPNHPNYGLTTRIFPYSVGALWADRLNQVLHARFALDAEALAAVRYLKWMAESHWGHPLLNGFDTMVRDKLLALSEVGVQLYFWMLQDYIYDPDTRYWAKTDDKYCWWQLAGYLFWTGRTGSALVTDHAGIEPGWQHAVERFQKNCPDMIEALKAWDKTGCKAARAAAHVTGQDPCVGIQIGPSCVPDLTGPCLP